MGKVRHRKGEQFAQVHTASHTELGFKFKASSLTSPVFLLMVRIGGVAQREQGTKGGTSYRARKHQSEGLFPPGSLGNTKQSFLTSETQDVIEHFILEAPVSPDSLGRVTRVWRDQLSSSARLAVSLRVCFSRGACILPPRRQTPGPHGGSGVLVMAPLRNTLTQDVHTLNCRLLMTQQVSTYIATH